MKVSIITVTFNSDRFLENCINSVISQDYSDIEYILIDGMSSDSTLDIIRKYERNISRWISEKDNGIYDALNKGMSFATGDIIGVLHSDDIFASTDVISSVVNSFFMQKVDSVYGDLEYVYPDNTNKIYRLWKGISYNRNLFKRGWMPAHTTFFFRSELLPKFGNYITHYFSSSDYEFMLRYLYKYRVSSYYLPKLIVKMRKGGLSNRNLFQRLRANRRDYLAMKANGLPFPFFVSILKPLSKLHQYYLK